MMLKPWKEQKQSHIEHKPEWLDHVHGQTPTLYISYACNMQQDGPGSHKDGSAVGEALAKVNTAISFASVLGSRVDAVMATETYDAVRALRGISRVGAGRGGRAADKEKTRAL